MQFGQLQRSGSREKLDEILLPEVESPVPVYIRPVSALQESDARRFALTEAKRNGTSDPKDGDPVYDTALWSAIVAASYFDSDEKRGNGASRPAFFDKGAAQVRELPTDTIAYLFQRQQAWQEEISPTFKAKSVGEMIAAARSLAEEDGDVFFYRCSPFTQTALARFMAGLLTTSDGARLLDGLRSAASTTTASKSATKTRKRTRKTTHS